MLLEPRPPGHRLPGRSAAVTRARPTPPTLATQLNNGDIAAERRLLARRSRSLPSPARGTAGSPERAPGAAGRGHGYQPGGGGGGGLLPARHCPERSRPPDSRTLKGKWVGTARERGGGGARAAPPSPRPHPRREVGRLRDLPAPAAPRGAARWGGVPPLKTRLRDAAFWASGVRFAQLSEN